MFIKLLRQFRKYFFSGIATIFPIFLTIYTFVLVFRLMDGIVGKYINALLWKYYGYKVPGLGFIISIIVVISIGILANHFFGKRIIPLFERLFLKIPFVEHIYPPAKQLSSFLFNEDARQQFRKVVLAQYPEPGSYALGFVTNENIAAFNDAVQNDLVIVLISMPPNPFTGFLLCVARSKVHVLDVSIDQALKYIVSGGIVANFTTSDHLINSNDK